MKEDTRPAVKHEFEHSEPTVIHDPEEDLTILAKWLRRAMAKGPQFWWMLTGVVLVAIIVSMLATALSRGRSSTGQAWTALAFAERAGEKVEIADAFANSEAGNAAKLQAATEYFFQATRDLPNNRESALPQLKKALDLFQQVAKDTPKDSLMALAATFGAARTLEARNELPEAIQQYKAVAAGWPGTAEAKQSEKLATQLQDPEVVAFYKELYTYKAPAVPSPTSAGFPGLGGPGGLPADHPPLNGPTVNAPPLSGLPSLPPGMDLTKPSTGTPATIPSGPNPLDIAPPPSTPDPTKPTPKAATTPEPAKPAAKSELPSDPFAPAASPKR